MRRQLAIASALLLVLFVGGYFVYSAVFAESSAPAIVQATEEVPPAAAGQADAAAPKPPESFFRVLASEGKVESGSGTGAWAPLNAGDTVPVGHKIRSGADGKATVKLGDAANLTLPSKSGLTIGSEGEIAQVRLDYGRASVRSIAAGDVRMAFKGSDAEAVANEASFSAQTSGDGHVVVASDEGMVKLLAAGESIDIPTGYQSVVTPNSAPSTPQAIPSSFFLKVRRPQADNRKKVTIAGTTLPGSEITIKGVTGHAGSDGKFAMEVPLQEGRNRMNVVATDVLGRQGSKVLPNLLFDSTAPKADSEVEW